MSIFTIHADPRREILALLDPGTLENLRRVCKKFNEEASDERVWQAVADRLGTPQDNALEPRKKVYQFLKDLREKIRALPQHQLPEEIKGIVAKGSNIPTIEQVRCLQEFRKARTTCDIWEKLARAVEIQIPAIEWSNLEHILQRAKDFPSWWEGNQATISQYSTIGLCEVTLDPL